MPTYVYQIINEDGSEGFMFEVEQHMSDPVLTRHPETGEKVQKVYLPPNVSYKHTPGRVKQLTDTKNVEKAGFTKYVRDKVTGRYHKEAGKQGPDVFTPK